MISLSVELLVSCEKSKWSTWIVRKKKHDSMLDRNIFSNLGIIAPLSGALHKTSWSPSGHDPLLRNEVWSEKITPMLTYALASCLVSLSSSLGKWNMKVELFSLWGHYCNHMPKFALVMLVMLQSLRDKHQNCYEGSRDCTLPLYQISSRMFCELP